MGRDWIRRPAQYTASVLSGQARENGKAWAKEWRERSEEVKKGHVKAEVKEKASGCK